MAIKTTLPKIEIGIQIPNHGERKQPKQRKVCDREALCNQMKHGDSVLVPAPQVHSYTNYLRRRKLGYATQKEGVATHGGKTYRQVRVWAIHKLP